MFHGYWVVMYTEVPDQLQVAARFNGIPYSKELNALSAEFRVHLSALSKLLPTITESNRGNLWSF